MSELAIDAVKARLLATEVIRLLSFVVSALLLEAEFELESDDDDDDDGDGANAGAGVGEEAGAGLGDGTGDGAGIGAGNGDDGGTIDGTGTGTDAGGGDGAGDGGGDNVFARPSVTLPSIGPTVGALPKRLPSRGTGVELTKQIRYAFHMNKIKIVTIMIFYNNSSLLGKNSVYSNTILELDN